ncbi:MAG: HIT family protein [Alphaproteobacteria bacterium]|nr:HIT family protein [Alphaproteobacteria bacterium]
MARGFALHPQLAADTHEVGHLDLCRVLLAKDSSFPWLILVPERDGVREIHELSDTDQSTLLSEVTRATAALGALFAPDKLNVAALGNAVPQLHVHVVARYRTDRAWPRPIWGTGPAAPYEEGRLASVLARLRAALVSGRAPVRSSRRGTGGRR